MTRSVCLLAFVISLSLGCSGAPPTRPEVADFYRGWPELTPEIESELNEARSRVRSDPGNRDNLLHLARAASRLARHQASLWLSAEPRQISAPYLARHEEALLRSRILETSQQALTYYYQLQFLGGLVDWRDEATQAWLLLLSERDDEARLKLERALAAPNLDDEARDCLRDLHEGVMEIPVEP